MPEYVSFAPAPLAQDATAPEEKLTETQQGMYKFVFEQFSKTDYQLPDEKAGQLNEEERFWLSRECLLRYLRASKWVQATAVTRLEATLKWRREMGLYDKITPEHVEPEATTGKEIIFGYDTHRRPAFYLFPSRQNTEESMRQVDFTVWAIERCIDLMGPGVENLAMMLNYADKAKNPSMGQAKRVLDIIQNHYPERLGCALIMNVPFLLNAFFKLISPFIDPVTREKLRFNPKVVEDGLFVQDQLMQEWWGGGREFVYDHKQYWPALVQLTQDRKKVWMECWRELGGTVGVSEWDYKRAAEKKTAASAPAPAPAA